MTDPAPAVPLAGPLLVPYDGSEPAGVALSFAAALAPALGERTHVVYVGEDDPPFLASVAGGFQSPVTVGVVAGEVDSVIVAEAERVDAGLIVLGSRGRAVLTGLLFGSTARAVLTGCHRPTLLTHEDTLVPAHGSAVVVAAVEATYEAASIVRAARRMADALGGAVSLVSVHNVDLDLARNPTAYGVTADEWEEQLQTVRERVFEPLRAFAGAGHRETLRIGVPAEQIRAHVEELGASIVVVGRRGASGVEVDGWRSVAFALAIEGPFATLVL